MLPGMTEHVLVVVALEVCVTLIGILLLVAIFLHDLSCLACRYGTIELDVSKVCDQLKNFETATH